MAGRIAAGLALESTAVVQALGEIAAQDLQADPDRMAAAAHLAACLARSALDASPSSSHGLQACRDFGLISQLLHLAQNLAQAGGSSTTMWRRVVQQGLPVLAGRKWLSHASATGSPILAPHPAGFGKLAHTSSGCNIPQLP